MSGGLRSRLTRRFALAGAAMSLAAGLSGCARSSSPQATWGASAAAPCDGLDSAGCMLPFPDDYYTEADPTTATGRRVVFPPGALPKNSAGTAIDPRPYERNDGFSPGSTLLAHVPGLDLGRSAVATLSDIGASLDPNAPIVVADTDTMHKVAYWAELDANDPDTREQLLLIHPAASLHAGHHYVVALRYLRHASGRLISPEPMFAALLRGSGPTSGHRGAHLAHLASLLGPLRRVGVQRQGLFLAWDFTVISTRSLDGPALAMRDKAFAGLHGAVPSYEVTKVVDAPPSVPQLAREVTGTLTVPSFLSRADGGPGSVMHLGADGLPAQERGYVVKAPFQCEIPKAADSNPADPAVPVHPALIGLYGHGLFSSAAEVDGTAVAQLADAHDFVACATDWTGLARADIPYDLSMTKDLSRFESVADRLTQAILDAQFLGRLLDDRRGFAADPAFQSVSHQPLIDPGSGLDYFGVSEGAIIGGAVTAVSSDIHRAVLTVPGMDFDVLIDRSADFSAFAGLLDRSYPDRMVQQFLFDVLQMLWDRGETDGYAAHLGADPLPGAARHQVLLAEAFGDHQVANVTTETEARTIAAAVHEPALGAGRSGEASPMWGLAALPDGPSRGPALYVWDSGVPAPPLSNVAPTAGSDPHGTVPLLVPAFWSQAASFFSSGEISDPCGDVACTAVAPTS